MGGKDVSTLDEEQTAEPEPESHSGSLSDTAPTQEESTQAARAEEEKQMKKKHYSSVLRIDPIKGAKLVEAGAFDVVIDVRSAAEYRKGHLPGAQHGMSTLTSECKDKHIAVYCWHGWDRSSPAALYLVSQGFSHIYDLGGLQYMGDPDLSEAPVEPQPTCNGASKADVHAILAAGPKIMPDNIADGRKGCDGLINSGKKKKWMRPYALRRKKEEAKECKAVAATPSKVST